MKKELQNLKTQKSIQSSFSPQNDSTHKKLTQRVLELEIQLNETKSEKDQIQIAAHCEKQKVIPKSSLL